VVAGLGKVANNGVWISKGTLDIANFDLPKIITSVSSTSYVL
jgi:hypothetical protein